MLEIYFSLYKCVSVCQILVLFIIISYRGVSSIKGFYQADDINISNSNFLRS